MPTPYLILDRKRRGEVLSDADIAAVVAGATDGSWSDAQLAAFLMAAATVGMSSEETRALTMAMLDSGERWRLADEVPELADKHSTGGVGDKVSLVLSPVMATCGIPVAMLTGRGLGHTAGTADKLEGIPGLDLQLSRARILELLGRHGMAIGVATEAIAPADRTLYSLRDVTGTVASIPLIVASIVSKKMALGARAIVYDVKTGSGAFLEDLENGRQLARLLVETSHGLGAAAAALITDMNQPLGRWVGHNAELLETLECLRGEGPQDLQTLVVEQTIEAAGLLDIALDRRRVESTLGSGEAYERFMQWAASQGASAGWLARPTCELAPYEATVRATAQGRLTAVDTREIGIILAEAGGGRRRDGDGIDHGIAFRYDRRLGDELAVGDRIGTIYLREEDAPLLRRLSNCFEIGTEADPPPLIWERIGPVAE